MYIIILVYVLWFAIKTVPVNLQSCNYITDFNVEYVDSENSEWKSVKLSSCITDASFTPKEVKQVSVACRDYSVPKLEANFINNMESLTKIYIGKCHTEEMEPGAFSNLSELEKVNIYNNPIKNIQSGVFNILPSLQMLYIYNNKISHIEDDAFANLPNLKEISLENNKLAHLKREWFTNTSNIELFSVFRNTIREIPSGMFHGWGKLKKLNLDSNAISVIGNDIFKDSAPIMTYLSLHHNRLTSLSPNVFSDSVFIDHLVISGNLLNYLPEEFLNRIRVANIALNGNPFSCPCLEKTHKILLERDVTVDNPVYTDVEACKGGNVPVCGFSSNSSRTCIESTDKELTRRVISYMKEIHYDTTLDKSGQQCAMFDEIDISP